MGYKAKRNCIKIAIEEVPDEEVSRNESIYLEHPYIVAYGKTKEEAIEKVKSYEEMQWEAIKNEMVKDSLKKFFTNLFECDEINNVEIKDSIFHCDIKMMHEYDVKILIEYDLGKDTLKAKTNYLDNIREFKNFSRALVDPSTSPYVRPLPNTIREDLEEWVDAVMKDWEDSFTV